MWFNSIGNIIYSPTELYLKATVWFFYFLFLGWEFCVMLIGVERQGVECGGKGFFFPADLKSEN